jgi:hypothetical protein
VNLFIYLFLNRQFLINRQFCLRKIIFSWSLLTWVDLFRRIRDFIVNNWIWLIIIWHVFIESNILVIILCLIWVVLFRHLQWKINYYASLWWTLPLLWHNHIWICLFIKAGTVRSSMLFDRLSHQKKGLSNISVSWYFIMKIAFIVSRLFDTSYCL